MLRIRLGFIMLCKLLRIGSPAQGELSGGCLTEGSSPGPTQTTPPTSLRSATSPCAGEADAQPPPPFGPLPRRGRQSRKPNIDRVPCPREQPLPYGMVSVVSVGDGAQPMAGPAFLRPSRRERSPDRSVLCRAGPDCGGVKGRLPTGGALI